MRVNSSVATAELWVKVGETPEGVVVDAKTRTVAVATRNPNELVLIDADSGTGTCGP